MLRHVKKALAMALSTRDPKQSSGLSFIRMAGGGYFDLCEPTYNRFGLSDNRSPLVPAGYLWRCLG